MASGFVSEESLRRQRNAIRFWAIALCLAAFVPAQITRQHPGYQLVDIPLANFNSGITGMDFLPDGRMVITTYRGDTSKAAGGVAFGRTTWGQAYIIENIQGAPSGVKHTQIADQFIDAMGVKVVNGDIYIGEINRIIKLKDADGDGLFETKETVAELSPDDANLAYSYGPIHKDGFLYMALGSPVSFRATGRNSVVKVPITGGKAEVIATGLRSPNGIGFGPDNEIFVTDNQGNYRPAPILTHIQTGKFYGFSMMGNNTATVTPASLQLPYQTFNNSPTQPLYLPSGRYAGQFIYGDWAKTALYRAFVEKVNGSYQGAAFFLTGRLKSPVERMVMDSNGVIYLGEMTLAKGPNGPQKLIPKLEVEVFDMLAIRSRKGGLELEFTHPVGASAAQTSLYTLEHWHYTPTSNYYNDPQEVTPLTVSTAQISEDQKRVYLEIAGLAASKVVHVKVGTGLQSSSGQALWSTEGYYTLNSISDSDPQLTGIHMKPETHSRRPMQARLSGNQWILKWDSPRFECLTLHNLQGARLQTIKVTGLRQWELPSLGNSGGLTIATLEGPGERVTQVLRVLP
jgi:hypothetical protein